MKAKITLTFLVFLAIWHSSLAQSFSQYFDGADTIPGSSVFIHLDTASTNIWQVGKPNKPLFNSAATVPNALVTDTVNFYPANNSSSFQFSITSPMVGWGIWALQWKQKIDLDSAADGGLIEFSADGGTTWESAFDNPHIYNFYGFDSANVAQLPNGAWAFTSTDTTWRDIWLCYDMSWLSFADSVLIRFTLQTDSVNHNKEGWIIDNLQSHQTIIHTAAEGNLEKQYLKVFPNPTSDRLFIEAKKLQEFHLIESMALLNAEGKIMRTWKNIPTKFFIDTKNYPTGLYYLTITTNLKTETFPVVVNRD